MVCCFRSQVDPIWVCSGNQRAARLVSSRPPEASIIFGAVIDDTLGGEFASR